MCVRLSFILFSAEIESFYTTVRKRGVLASFEDEKFEKSFKKSAKELDVKNLRKSSFSDWANGVPNL